jgi:hypothetical protein
MTKTTTKPPRLYEYRLVGVHGVFNKVIELPTTSMQKACVLAMSRFGIQGTYDVRKDIADIRDVNGAFMVDWQLFRL